MNGSGKHEDIYMEFTGLFQHKWISLSAWGITSRGKKRENYFDIAP